MADSFALPVDVPWKLVAASDDMMDTKFSDDSYPPDWCSSLAIYAYEPSPADLPQQMCDQTITYLKVTCSMTGYQPTSAETQQLPGYQAAYANPLPVMHFAEDVVVVPNVSDSSIPIVTIPAFATSPASGASFSNISVAYASTGQALTPFPGGGTIPEGQYGFNAAQGIYMFSNLDANKVVHIECDYQFSSATSGLGDLTGSDDFQDAYFACYGALLNVSVFPSTTTVPVENPTATPVAAASVLPSTPGTTSYTFAPVIEGDLFNPASLQGPDGSTFTFTSYETATGTVFPSFPDLIDGQIGLVPNMTIEVDLPYSTNVQLQIFPGRLTQNKGTITAFQGDTQVFQCSLTSIPIPPPRSATFTIVSISVASPITKLVITSTNQTALLSEII